MWRRSPIQRETPDVLINLGGGEWMIEKMDESGQ